MGFVPERDVFDNQFSKEQMHKIGLLYDEIEDLMNKGSHEDLCNCSGWPDDCVSKLSQFHYTPDAENAIMYLVSKGKLTL